MNVVGMPDEAVKISKRPVKWDLPCRLSSWVGVDEPRGETELHAGDDNRYYLPRKKKITNEQHTASTRDEYLDRANNVHSKWRTTFQSDNLFSLTHSTVSEVNKISTSQT
jgi:hypothetical protein